IPIVIVTGEASYHAAYDHCTAAYLEQAGAHNTFIRLADHGVHGNGHMMMIEKNSDAIAAVIAQWLDRHGEEGGQTRAMARAIPRVRRARLPTLHLQCYRCRNGGVVTTRGAADCTALSTSTRPEPKSSLRSPGPSRLALPVRMRLMSAGVSRGLRSSSSAAMPLTSAAATEVPVVSW